MSAERFAYVRGTAEYVGESRIRYVWPCKHSQTRDHNTGVVTKRMSPTVCKLMVRYWAGSGGVILPPCKRRHPRGNHG